MYPSRFVTYFITVMFAVILSFQSATYIPMNVKVNVSYSFSFSYCIEVEEILMLAIWVLGFKVTPDLINAQL